MMDRKPATLGPADDTEPGESGSDTIDWAKVATERAARQDSRALPGRQDSNTLPASTQPTVTEPVQAQPTTFQPTEDDAALSIIQNHTAMPPSTQVPAVLDALNTILDDGEPAPRPPEESAIVTGQRISPRDSRQQLSHAESEILGRIEPEFSPPPSEFEHSPSAGGDSPAPVSDQEEVEAGTAIGSEEIGDGTEVFRERSPAPVWRNAFGGGARTESRSHVQEAYVWRNAFGGSARTPDVYTDTGIQWAPQCSDQPGYIDHNMSLSVAQGASRECTTAASQLRPEAPVFTPESGGQPPTPVRDSDSQQPSPCTSIRSSPADGGRRHSEVSYAHFEDESLHNRERSQSELQAPVPTNEDQPTADLGHYWTNPANGSK